MRKKIDFHVHLGSSEKARLFFDPAEYKRLAVSVGVEKAVAMPNISSRLSRGELNSHFLNSVFGDEFYFPFLLCGPGERSVIGHLAAKEIQGLKFHPSLSQVAVSSKEMFQLWDGAQEYNPMVIVHCGRNEKSNIRYLVRAAIDFPGIRFVGAHLGGNATDLVDDALDYLSLMETLPQNLFLDTSAIKQPILITRALDILGGTKILFGSDVPYADLKLSINCVEYSREDKLMDNVFYGNAARLLGIF